MSVEETDSPALLADRAYERLRGLLRSGRLAAGQFLSMPRLVELLEMPLAATREAVKRVEARGLVTVLPKRGLQVMGTGAEITRQCLDMRAALDAEGARRLVANRDAIPLRELRRAHLDVLSAAHRAPTPELSAIAMATDLTLHDALAQGLGNPYLARAYGENRDRIAVIQHTRPFLQDRIVSAMEEHLAIIDALAEGDGEAAVAAIGTHLRQTMRWWGVSA